MDTNIEGLKSNETSAFKNPKIKYVNDIGPIHHVPGFIKLLKFELNSSIGINFLEIICVL